MPFRRIINKIVYDFITLFNERKIDELSNMWSKEMYIESSLVKTVYPYSQSNRIEGKENVVAYYKELVKKLPSYYLIFNENNYKVNSKKVVYDALLKTGERNISEVSLNEHGKIEYIITNYVHN
ncbi:MAG: hypothetical protein IT215_03895 [Chitinophagaceae bacterium]|nr:hypothetical protein [Chitinophagaceae bacterium]HMN33693.1 hypothetical protein [Chitinophagaceae bacterium]